MATSNSDAISWQASVAEPGEGSSTVAKNSALVSPNLSPKLCDNSGRQCWGDKSNLNRTWERHGDPNSVVGCNRCDPHVLPDVSPVVLKAACCSHAKLVRVQRVQQIFQAYRLTASDCLLLWSLVLEHNPKTWQTRGLLKYSNPLRFGD